jgi:hypothetical protein
MDSINYPLVYVVWKDAVSCDAWIDADAEHRLTTIHTVGFIIAEDQESITLCMNLDMENGNVSMTMTIPLAWIESMDYLERK